MKSQFHQYRPHPWHGISTGKRPPQLINAFIEISPFDGIKYELDKETGYVKVDRPQLTSSLPPSLYGFIPRTFCGENVRKLSKSATRGDGDPLDVCVLSERPIQRSEIIVPARVIGGFRMLDRGEADDKIIAVVESDPFWNDVQDIQDLAPVFKQRLEHYFLTYKHLPGKPNEAVIEETYGLEAASKVILASIEDYLNAFERPASS